MRGLVLLVALFLPVSLSAQDSLIAKRAKGSATAPVTVYEMSDFQCPYCKTFTDEVFPTIFKEYISTGKVRWVFINLPINSRHPNAQPAAEYAMCAAKQNKFWPAHDMLYKKQKEWETLKDPAAFLVSQMPALGLKKDLMLTCLTTRATRDEVVSDAQGANRTGARSTPSFFVEGGLLQGIYPIATWRTVLDSVIAVKKKKP